MRPADSYQRQQEDHDGEVKEGEEKQEGQKGQEGGSSEEEICEEVRQEICQEIGEEGRQEVGKEGCSQEGCGQEGCTQEGRTQEGRAQESRQEERSEEGRAGRCCSGARSRAAAGAELGDAEPRTGTGLDRRQLRKRRAPLVPSGQTRAPSGRRFATGSIARPQRTPLRPFS